jgi:uncharacterized integral membrane protein
MTRDRGQAQQATQYPEVDGPGMMDRIRLGLGIAGAIVLVIFLVQNLESTTISFLFWEWDMPLIFALIASAVLGALAWGIVGFLRRRAQDAELRAEVAGDRARRG